MTDPTQVLDEWIAEDGYGSREELISRLQRAQDDAQDYEEAAEYAALDAARANSQRDQLRSRITGVEVLAERALSHGYDLDPQDVLDALKTKGGN